MFTLLGVFCFRFSNFVINLFLFQLYVCIADSFKQPVVQNLMSQNVFVFAVLPNLATLNC
jgi:hypothetical protein